MPYEWSEDLATRIEWVDLQHQEMLKKASVLVKAFDEGRGKEEILETLRFLGDYIVIHFQQEEELQQRYHYPYYPAHKAMHDEFIKDYKKLKEQVAVHGVSTYLVYEVKERLVMWIRNHINMVDKSMSDFLIQNYGYALENPEIQENKNK